jgi:hypothetical protein
VPLTTGESNAVLSAGEVFSVLEKEALLLHWKLFDVPALFAMSVKDANGPQVIVSFIA